MTRKALDGRWTVAYWVPEQEAYGLLIAARGAVVYGLGLAVVVALMGVLVASLWIRRQISNPVRTVASAADLVGSGDLRVTVPQLGKAEVRKLCDAVGAMVGRLSELVGAIREASLHSQGCCETRPVADAVTKGGFVGPGMPFRTGATTAARRNWCFGNNRLCPLSVTSSINGKRQCRDRPGIQSRHGAMAPETIMIIDDDRSFTEAASLLLRDHGYEVQQALTGQAVIAESSEQPPDLVIIDVHLPDIDGVDVAHELRQTHPGTPVILISSDDSRETVTRCTAIDYCSFLPKPLVPEKLMTAIADALDGSNGLP